MKLFSDFFLEINIVKLVPGVTGEEFEVIKPVLSCNKFAIDE